MTTRDNGDHIEPLHIPVLLLLLGVGITKKIVYGEPEMPLQSRTFVPNFDVSKILCDKGGIFENNVCHTLGFACFVSITRKMAHMLVSY